MNLIEFFKDVVKILKNRNVRYALAGGMVSSIYRTNARTTKDLDFLILAESKTEETAVSIIEKFGLESHLIRKADLEGGPMFAIKRKSTVPYIIAGRAQGNSEKIGLDFILPEMPWFESALLRAEQNEIDFGFGKIPCLTIEDVIIAKFYSLKNDSTRFNDLDDLKSIFQANYKIDLAYLSGQMQKLKIEVPIAIKNLVPKPLIHISKRILKDFRRNISNF